MLHKTRDVLRGRGFELSAGSEGISSHEKQVCLALWSHDLKEVVQPRYDVCSTL
jgi:hypothetical protein